jgi:tRNA uridine 5-carboxymethylaminomethyl modification enzyme
LISNDRFARFQQKCDVIAKEKDRLKQVFVRPDTVAGNKMADLLVQPLLREYSLLDLLRRPNLSYQQIMMIDELGPFVSDEKAAEQIEIQLKYEGYINRQEDDIARSLRQETMMIPDDLNYSELIHLSAEVRQKLAAVRPATLGMASRIPGVTPAAVSLLLVYLKKRKTS